MAGKGKAKGSPLSAMTRNADGSVTIPADVAQQVIASRSRLQTLSQVPSTPRFMNRAGGGVGVERGAVSSRALTNDQLRDLRERSPLLQVIHAARLHQVGRLSRKWSGRRGDIGWKVVHKDHHVADAKIPAGFDSYIQRFEALLERPAPGYHINSTKDLLTGLEEDLLTINRPAVEVLYSAVDSKRVVGFRPLDGALVWPTLLYEEYWRARHPGWGGRYDSNTLSTPEVAEIMSQGTGFDFTRLPEYCVVRDGILEGVFERGHLIVAPVQNRTDIRYAGYPPSNVEMAAALAVAYLNAFEFNTSYFTRGMLADMILGVPAEMGDANIDAFVDTLRQATQGLRKAHQPVVLPMTEGHAIQKIDLKGSTNRDMQFEVQQSLLISFGTACYRMDPSSLGGIKPWSGGSGPSLSEGSRQNEVALAKEEGLQHDVGHLGDHILNELARRCHPDLRVAWEWGDFDPQKEASIYEIQCRVSSTRNEIRLVKGEAPMGFWLNPKDYEKASDKDKQRFDQNPWNWPTDPTFAQAMQAQAVQAQQEKMQEQQQQQPDGYGVLPGDEEEDETNTNPNTNPGPTLPLQKSTPITVYVEEILA